MSEKDKGEKGIGSNLIGLNIYNKDKSHNDLITLNDIKMDYAYGDVTIQADDKFSSLTIDRIVVRFTSGLPRCNGEDIYVDLMIEDGSTISVNNLYINCKLVDCGYEIKNINGAGNFFYLVTDTKFILYRIHKEISEITEADRNILADASMGALIGALVEGLP